MEIFRLHMDRNQYYDDFVECTKNPLDDATILK